MHHRPSTGGRHSGGAVGRRALWGSRGRPEGERRSGGAVGRMERTAPLAGGRAPAGWRRRPEVERRLSPLIRASPSPRPGCPYSCVKRAPHAFAYADDTGTARAISQRNGENYLVQLAVGQCLRKCIHYVTPCHRIILEDILARSLEPCILPASLARDTEQVSHIRS